MHTHQTDTHNFYHNGGFDGNVEIVHKATGDKMVVPFFALRSLVAKYVRLQRISILEDATDSDILLDGCFVREDCKRVNDRL